MEYVAVADVAAADVAEAAASVEYLRSARTKIYPWIYAAHPVQNISITS